MFETWKESVTQLLGELRTLQLGYPPITLRVMSLDLSRGTISASRYLFDALQLCSRWQAVPMIYDRTRRLGSAERDGYVGRLVTGTFEHSSGELLNLFIAGESTLIGPRIPRLRLPQMYFVQFLTPASRWHRLG